MTHKRDSKRTAKHLSSPAKPKRAWWVGLTAASLTGCGDAELEEAKHFRNPPSCHEETHPVSHSTDAASPAAPRARQGAATPSAAKFIDARVEPTSTFGLSVETASYTRLRASLQEGRLPAADDVRVEEMLNHFSYAYPAPQHTTFGVVADVAVSPWHMHRRLVRVGIKGRKVSIRDVKASVRWNPDAVRSYRLIGYEGRPPDESDSVDGSKAGGDVNAGHALTVFYEVEPVAERNLGQTFGTLVIRSKSPTGADAPPTEVALHGADTPALEMPSDFRFAASVIAFAVALDITSYGGLPFEAIEKLAAEALGEDHDGQRAEFVSLVRKAKQNWPKSRSVASPAPPGWCYIWDR